MIQKVGYGAKEAKYVHKPYGPYEKYIKRPMDFFFSVIAIFVLSPILLITALLVRVNLGSPVIFTQDRPGMNGKIFKLYKFRSMSDRKDREGNLLPDDERITSFGRKLRSTSLDELPELFNIAKGDMSIIGPRAFICGEKLPQGKISSKRYLVKPGIISLAQVYSGRKLSYQDTLKCDIEYYDNYSLWFDIKIFFKSLKTISKRILGR